MIYPNFSGRKNNKELKENKKIVRKINLKNQKIEMFPLNLFH